MDAGEVNGGWRSPRDDRRSSRTEESDDGRVRRPITSETAIAIALQLLERGVPGIEQGPDGRLWALGVDRRRGDRRGQ